MHFAGDAQRFEHQAHFRAHVLERINRWHREIAALDGRAMTRVTVLVFLAGVPGRFFGFDLEETTRHVVAPAHAVEHEEFGFRAEIGGVAQARCLHVRFCALGQRPRIALIRLAVTGLDHIAAQDKRRLFEERVDVGGIRIRHQLHVRGFDALPASDRRAVERVARREFFFVEMGHRYGHMVFFAAGIGEAEVDKFDFVLFHHLHHVGNGLAGHQELLAECFVCGGN